MRENFHIYLHFDCLIGCYFSFFFCPPHERNNNRGIDKNMGLEGVGIYENCLMDRILGKCYTSFISIFILCYKIFNIPCIGGFQNFSQHFYTHAPLYFIFG